MPDTPELFGDDEPRAAPLSTQEELQHKPNRYGLRNPPEVVGEASRAKMTLKLCGKDLTDPHAKAFMEGLDKLITSEWYVGNSKFITARIINDMRKYLPDYGYLK